MVKTEQPHRSVVKTSELFTVKTEANPRMKGSLKTEQPHHSVVKTEQPHHSVVKTEQPHHSVVKTEQPCHSVVNTGEVSVCTRCVHAEHAHTIIVKQGGLTHNC